MTDFSVSKVEFSVVDEVHRSIPEFGRDHLVEGYDEKCRGSDPSNLVCFSYGEKVAYGVAYDKFEDGSYYLWMAGVKPHSRREGAMSALVSKLEMMAFQKGYESVKIKTRNEREEMRHFLIEKGYKVCDFQFVEDLDRSEILTVKKIDE
ncbi:GNAT family N-acetyltransferase [Nanohaloarchaea archaeon H01]|nr:GNAT family N-acetyltransferase [Nanohaloarchaea archaeon H01]